jgi:N-acetylmuramoyl-L-alanine amidase CwlA
MSFDIVKNFIPGLPQEAYDGGIGNYVGVVAHATANNGDSADSERNYESTTWQSAFVHFFVDDTKIEQVADTNYLCYGAGHTANHSGYAQVELCQSTDATKFNSAYAQYVWLLAYLLYERKLGVTDNVTLMSHAEVSAKWKETDHTDPLDYLASHGKTWSNVVTDVTAAYKLMEGDAMTTTPANIESLDHVVITTQAGLNLRASANTTSAILAVVPYNTMCEVIGTEPGWYEIKYAGAAQGQGWLSASYVTFTPKAVTAVPKPEAVTAETPAVAVKVATPVAPVTPVVPTPAPAVAPAGPVKVAPVTPVVSVAPATTSVSTATPPTTATTTTPAVASPTAPITIQTSDVQTLTQLNTLLNKILGGK